MVAAKAGLEVMLNEKVESQVKQKEKIVKEFLETKIKSIDDSIEIRGIGLIWGIDVKKENLAKEIAKECFKNRLVIERAGRNNSVVKLMPPLVIDEETLLKGLSIIENAVKKIMKS